MSEEKDLKKKLEEFDNKVINEYLIPMLVGLLTTLFVLWFFKIN